MIFSTFVNSVTFCVDLSRFRDFYHFGKFSHYCKLIVFSAFIELIIASVICTVLIVNSCYVHASRSSWTIMWKHVFRSTVIILVNPELSKITVFLAKC